jgi:hypothetical protein
MPKLSEYVGLPGQPGIGTSRIPGRYYPLCVTGFGSNNWSTRAGTGNVADLAPWIPRVSFTPSNLGCVPTSGGAGATGKVVVYSADSAGYPNALLYDSGTLDFAVASATHRSAASAITFAAGSIYWVGIQFGTTAATCRTIPNASCLDFAGLGTSPTQAGVTTLVRKTGLTFASPPNPWGGIAGSTFVTSDTPFLVIGLAP